MKRINSGYFIQGVLVLFFAGAVAGCGEQAEPTEQNQPEVITQASEDNTGNIEQQGAIETKEAEDAGTAEAVEESLESILARADEIIQRTESSLDKADDDIKQGGEEKAENITEKTDVMSLETFETDETVAKVVDDRLEVVKASPDLIRKIQQALQDAGFNPGPADGMMGPRTQNALVAFQNQHSLVTGRITKETLRELNIDF
jgi:hypothetical protein